MQVVFLERVNLLSKIKLLYLFRSKRIIEKGYILPISNTKVSLMATYKIEI
jgi:hypothetical protein